MAYTQQLKILLWKNLTQKKRAPVVTVFEIVIPIALVTVLVLLRSRAPQVPNEPAFPPAQPLLSAGFIPVLQLGCDGGNTDAHGFIKQDTSIIHNILDVLHRLTGFIRDQIDGTLGQPPHRHGPLVNDSIYTMRSERISKGTPEIKIDLIQLLTNPHSFRHLQGRHFDILANSTDKIINILGAKDKDDITSISLQVDTIRSQLEELFLDPRVDFPKECTLPSNRPESFKHTTTEGSTAKPITTRKPFNPDDEILEEIIRIWRIMKRIVCNLEVQPVSPTDQDRNPIKDLENDLDLPLEEMIRNILKKKLRILYAPRGGQVDEIINDVVGSLSIITDITKMAQYWFVISEKIREDLNRTIHDPILLSSFKEQFDSKSAKDPVDINTIHWKSAKRPDVDVQSERFNDALPVGSSSLRSTSQGPKQFSLQPMTRPRPTTTHWLWPGWTTRTPPPRWSTTPRYPTLPIHPPQPTENPILPLVSVLLRLLDAVDSVACIWLKVADIELNPIHLFKGFESERDLETFFLEKASSENVEVFGSLVFDSRFPNNDVPDDVVYKIRMNASFTQSTQAVQNLWWHPRPEPLSKLYYVLGFSWLQDLVDRSIINLKVGRDVLEPGVYIQEMPQPCFIDDDFHFVIEHMIPLSLMLAWIFPVAMLARAVVTEKEHRLREVMKLMGMKGSVIWLSWLITSVIQTFLVVIILTLFLKFGKVLPHTDGSLTFVILLLYGINGIFYSFFMSVLFSKAKIAAAVAGILYLIIYVPYMFVASLDSAGQIQGVYVKMLVSIFTPTAMGLAGKYLAYPETAGDGLLWSTVGVPVFSSDQCTMMHLLIMMAVSIVVYAFLIWYLDNVKPGPYGQPMPWYFPCTRSYWCSKHSGEGSRACKGVYCVCSTDCKVQLQVYNKPNNSKFERLTSLEVNPLHFEAVQANREPTIHMESLQKVYSSGKVAVKNLSLDLFEGQILSFLGHNGAGKTTTMSMLTGMIPITSGEATIYGYNVKTEMDQIRNILGMCPQHNVLFENLTVEEHLYFYASIKDETSHIQRQVDKMVVDLGLLPKKYSAVKALSGGMKRKLSVGIAFIGSSKAVILDEPTAGVDPSSRREIWDLLLKFKEGRTIMLSTHHMDEADVLGDRIAVISHGQLLCCGSSLFLKSTFGEGYHLTIVKRPRRSHQTGNSAIVSKEDIIEDQSDSKSLYSLLTQTQSETETTSVRQSIPSETASMVTATTTTTKSSLEHERKCYTMKITLFIQTIVNGAYMKSETNTELHYILPFKEAGKGSYSKLFTGLSNQKEMLDIKSFGVSDTKLEEVFLKVIGYAKNEQEKAADARRSQSPIAASMINKMPVKSPPHMETLKDLQYESIELDITSRDRECSTSFRKRHRRNKSESAVAPKRSPAVRSLSWDSTAGQEYQQLKKNRKSEEHAMGSPTFKVNVLTGYELYIQQFTACIAKRGLFVARNWKSLFSQVFLPVIFVTVAMLISIITGPGVDHEPAIEMSTAQYINTSKWASKNYVTVADQRVNYNFSFDAMPDKMMKTFTMASGIGATCIVKKEWPNGTEYGDRCKGHTGISFVPRKRDCDHRNERPHQVRDCQSDSWGNSLSNYSSGQNIPRCVCKPDYHGLQCDGDPIKDIPKIDVVTRDKLENITRLNETLYLQATYRDYIQSRYGGLSFGNVRLHVPEWIGHFPLELRKIEVRNVAKVWYDTHGYHAIPIYINAMNNAILRANIPKVKGNPSTYGITTINQPMNSTTSVEGMASRVFGSELVIAILVISGLAFIPAGYSLFLVQEKACKAKHLQYVSGLNPVIYWSTNIIFDLILYLIPALICVVMFVAFNIPAFVKGENLTAVVALLLMFGVGCIPTTYPATFMFDDASGAYVFMAVFNIISGTLCISITFILSIFQQEDLRTVGRILEYVFLVFPNYAMGKALMDISINHIQNEFNLLIGVGKYSSPLGLHVIGKSLIAMGCVGIICITFTLLTEYHFFVKPRILSANELPNVEGEHEDEDVAREKVRVLQGDTSQDIVRMTNLTKIYHSAHRGDHLAVNQLCLGIPQGECFGMLGINGAGKTTTFKMLTGDHAPSGGNAFIKKCSILGDMHNVRQHIGYCPQFDALYDELSSREHLKLYCQLRGIPRSQQEEVVDWALKRLELVQYADKPAKSYSGGNKRKLSTAIALLGNPPVIFLDEPTAGMDPYAKRFLWDLILCLIQEGRCIILTSHSMEECETLCTRLAIMVQGKFRCLGSVQHLKDRFGDGYSILLTVKGPEFENNTTVVTNHLVTKLPDVFLKEHHHNLLHYEIPSEKVNLSVIFNVLETGKKSFPIEDYSVCQNTLDNIFINFVKEQSEGEMPDPLENEVIPEPNSGYTTSQEGYSRSTGLQDVVIMMDKNACSGEKSFMELEESYV